MHDSYESDDVLFIYLRVGNKREHKLLQLSPYALPHYLGLKVKARIAWRLEYGDLSERLSIRLGEYRLGLYNWPRALLPSANLVVKWHSQ